LEVSDTNVHTLLLRVISQLVNTILISTSVRLNIWFEQEVYPGPLKLLHFLVSCCTLTRLFDARSISFKCSSSMVNCWVILSKHFEFLVQYMSLKSKLCVLWTDLIKQVTLRIVYYTMHLIAVRSSLFIFKAQWIWGARMLVLDFVLVVIQNNLPWSIY